MAIFVFFISNDVIGTQKHAAEKRPHTFAVERGTKAEGKSYRNGGWFGMRSAITLSLVHVPKSDVSTLIFMIHIPYRRLSKSLNSDS